MAITIRSSFTVDAQPADVWKTMTDIERSAPCFPGAELKEQQPDGSYKGGFTVKLGPLTLKFAGKFKIADQNDANRTVVVSASGTDTKGRGGADAQINAAVTEAGAKTKVDVVSEVNLSGTVAQYGRGAGMIEALSQQLLNQFAKNLTALIEADAAHAEPVTHTLVGGDVPNGAAAAAPQDAAETAAPAPPAEPRRVRPAPAPVAPLDAGALMRKAMWQSIRNFFARIFRPGQQH
ncbi:Carbon monoxide dehydrogenase subunit G (CoxG) [Caballeronia arvi]|uniref:Carbon monoxide dehydrogenase subunit G (CoxG) n=1 Tax=Caballeronia arvi TaxID=1777135 RepID=A0A158KG08_9BURK|nr:SRPBCC family protein [Caballeronia arvi]SAL79994.1 Carbon monoxide dehydrogenase subunit G (CoxG) [Caballeronia arvi]